MPVCCAPCRASYAVAMALISRHERCRDAFSPFYAADFRLRAIKSAVLLFMPLIRSPFRYTPMLRHELLPALLSTYDAATLLPCRERHACRAMLLFCHIVDMMPCHYYAAMMLPRIVAMPISPRHATRCYAPRPHALPSYCCCLMLIGHCF